MSVVDGSRLLGREGRVGDAGIEGFMMEMINDDT
jgi:hypothetical protein